MTRRCLISALAAALPRRESILVHEHIIVDFIGADDVRPDRYDRDEVFRLARPKLEEIRKFGCVRFQDCTPNFLGRDPVLLQRLSDAVGLEIWTNTGFYKGAKYKFIPSFAHAEPAERWARRWIEEARRGVDGMKPRFIKIAVGAAPLDEIDRKLVRAAAITSRETGLTIAAHTWGGAAALAELDILGEEKISLRHFVWAHANVEKNHTFHEMVARAGAWVEFDGLGPKSLDWHRRCVEFMAQQGLLDRTLISQDAGWYNVGQPNVGNFRGYALLYTDFLPLLQPSWVRRLLWDNPRSAFG